MRFSLGSSAGHFLVGLVLLKQLTCGLTKKIAVSSNLKGTGSKFSSMEDGCNSATQVGVGASKSGSTVGATVYLSDECGDAWTGLSPGHWYQVDGIDGIIQASLCTGTNFDTMLSVWSGDCSNLTCVAGVDDSDTCSDTKQSETSFMSYINVSYSIFIHGWTGKTGNYTLTLADVTPSSSPSAAPSISHAPSVSSVPSPAPTPRPTNPYTPAPTNCFGGQVLRYWYNLFRGY